jgi:hypothetical protein
VTANATGKIATFTDSDEPSERLLALRTFPVSPGTFPSSVTVTDSLRGSATINVVKHNACA